MPAWVVIDGIQFENIGEKIHLWLRGMLRSAPVLTGNIQLDGRNRLKKNALFVKKNSSDWEQR